MANDFDSLWADAHTIFYATTKQRLDDRSLPLLTTLDDLKAELDKRQASFSEFREKKHAIFGALSTALGPLQLLTHIAAAGISNAYPPSGSAFSAFMYLLSAAGNVSAAYDAIEALLGELAYFTTRLTIHSQHEIPKELRGIVVQILCTLIRICAYAGRLMKHGRVSEYFRKLVLSKDKDISVEMEKLQRLTEAEARMVGALTLSVTKRTEKNVGDAVVAISQVNTGIQDVSVDISGLRDQVSGLTLKISELKNDDRTMVEQKQITKIRHALEPVIAVEETYRSILGKKVSDTGNWLLEERLLKTWISGDIQLLWISGGPGAGKSYLSSNLIQSMTKLFPQGMQATTRTSVAYYFCKDYDPDLRSFNKALRTIAFQICQNDPVYAKHVALVCSFPEDIRTTQSLWQKLFVDFFSGANVSSMAYILIDGIDEALEQERSTFLGLLKDIQQTSSTENKLHIQVTMVGRPEVSYDLECILEDNVPTIHVTAIKNSADIQHYVNTKVAKERNLKRISKALHKEIVTELTNRADGMFLWVDLMLKEVASKHKEIQMRQALREAPKGLVDMISHALDRMHHELSSEDLKDFQTLLSWVACAKRPFTLGELEDILKFTSEDGESVIYLEGELRKRFASFFNVIRDDGKSTEDLQIEVFQNLVDDTEHFDSDSQKTLVAIDDVEADDNDFGENMDIESNPLTTEVTLAHASFGDFFRMHHATGSAATDHNLWSLQVLKELLRMLCKKDLISDGWYKKPLFQYAAARWHDHLQDINFNTVEDQDRLEIGQRLFSMFHDEYILGSWTSLSIWMDTFRQAWIFTETNITEVQKWMAPELSKAVGEDEDNLLQNTINFLARQWLQRKGTITYPEKYFMVVKAYLNKVNVFESKDRPASMTDEEASNLTNNPPASILQVARYYKFEEDSKWCNRIGRTLRQARYYEAGKPFLQKAIDLAGPNDQPCRSMFALGYLLAQQEKYQEAIDVVEKGLETAKADSTITLADHTIFYQYWTARLINWYDSLEKWEDAILLCKDYLMVYPEEYSFATLHVYMLCREGQYSTAMDIFREASQDMLEEEGHSRLSEWCMKMMFTDDDDCASFYDAVVETSLEMNDIDFARTTYLNAIKAVKRADSDIILLMQADLATLIRRHYPNEVDKTVRVLEKVLDESKASKKDSATSLARIIIVEVLCEIYLTKALKGGKGSDEAAIAMDKMSKIWTTQAITNDPWDDSFGGDVLMSTRNSTLCLASLYRAFGAPEKARPLLKEHVKLGLDLLTDDDPDNDWQAYFKLADALARAGDNINALAALSLVGRRTVTDDAAQDDEGEEVEGLAYGTSECSGGCGTKTQRGADKFYNCLYCPNVCWEENCFQLLKEGKLKFDICGKDHEFLYKPETEPFPKGFVPVDGKIIPEKEWLADVRKQWEL